MKKRILSICLIVCLLAIAIGGATLAYFTETEQQTNVYTVGNIDIDLWENAEHTNGLDEVIDFATDLGKGTDDNLGFEYKDIMPGDTMEKIVTVDNNGEYDAYIALVIKQENYYDFNQNIDEYYENLDGYGATAMQGITDDVFPNWGLLYDKTQVAAPNAQVRYTITKAAADPVLGYGYVNSAPTSQGVQYYNYSGAYFTNGVKLTEVPEGDPDFMTMDDVHDRAWIVYLMVPAGESFEMDLTTVCPDYFDNNSVKAFANMKLDVKAFAIQAKGLEAKEAFAEALKPGFGF